MHSGDEVFDRAVGRVGVYSLYRQADRTIPIACLIRTSDWRPLEADWWHGKEVCIIGADLQGNFFLRHCDGSVRYWQHRSQTDEVLARSVREFAECITS